MPHPAEKEQNFTEKRQRGINSTTREGTISQMKNTLDKMKIFESTKHSVQKESAKETYIHHKGSILSGCTNSSLAGEKA